MKTSMYRLVTKTGQCSQTTVKFIESPGIRPNLYGSPFGILALNQARREPSKLVEEVEAGEAHSTAPDIFFI